MMSEIMELQRERDLAVGKLRCMEKTLTGTAPPHDETVISNHYKLRTPPYTMIRSVPLELS